jgi:hypothetical protein
MVTIQCKKDLFVARRDLMVMSMIVQLFAQSRPRMIVSMAVGFFILSMLLMIMAAVVIVTSMAPRLLNNSPEIASGCQACKKQRQSDEYDCSYNSV